MDSSTPKYWICNKVYVYTSRLGVFDSFGLRHLIKWQSLEFNSSISYFIYDRNFAPRNFSIFDGFFIFSISSYLFYTSLPHKPRKKKCRSSLCELIIPFTKSPDISDLFFPLNPIKDIYKYIKINIK